MGRGRATAEEFTQNAAALLERAAHGDTVLTLRAGQPWVESRAAKVSGPVKAAGGEPHHTADPWRVAEQRWLADHGTQYADQWVALDGDRLLTAG